MTKDVHLHRPDIEQMVNQITACGKISRADQQQFMSALLSQKSISQTEQALINRVFELLRRGRLRVVD
jgi:peptidoglycan hydrolase CwlO-like protein